MKRVSFKAWTRERQFVTFESIHEKESEAIRIGFSWAEASGFSSIEYYCIDTPILDGIRNVQRFNWDFNNGFTKVA